MKKYIVLLFVVGFSTVLFSCKNQKMAVNPGAQVTIDGTQDGVRHVQRDFEDAARSCDGSMVAFDPDRLSALNSSYLTDQAKREIDNLANLLAYFPSASLIVDGHTDATGTEEYNQWLSDKRAES